MRMVWIVEGDSKGGAMKLAFGTNDPMALAVVETVRRELAAKHGATEEDVAQQVYRGPWIHLEFDRDDDEDP